MFWNEALPICVWKCLKQNASICEQKTKDACTHAFHQHIFFCYVAKICRDHISVLPCVVVVVFLIGGWILLKPTMLTMLVLWMRMCPCFAHCLQCFHRMMVAACSGMVSMLLQSSTKSIHESSEIIFISRKSFSPFYLYSFSFSLVSCFFALADQRKLSVRVSSTKTYSLGDRA